MVGGLRTESIKALMRKYSDDAETMEIIQDALESFEAYHAAIYKLEMEKYLYASGAEDAEMYRVNFPHYDGKRTDCHNTVLSNIRVLNRLCEESGLPLLYSGTVSEKQPYRREVANAVMDFVAQVIQERN